MIICALCKTLAHSNCFIDFEATSFLFLFLFPLKVNAKFMDPPHQSPPFLYPNLTSLLFLTYASPLLSS